MLHDTLAGGERPATVLNWLERAATRTVLSELAAGHADPDDKELLHRYPAWHLLRRLRQRTAAQRPMASSTRPGNGCGLLPACSAGCASAG